MNVDVYEDIYVYMDVDEDVDVDVGVDIKKAEGEREELSLRTTNGKQYKGKELGRLVRLTGQLLIKQPPEILPGTFG